MNFTFGALLRLVRFTVRHPREGARAVMALDLPMEARWVTLVLAAVGAALLTSVSLALLPVEVKEMMGGEMPSPLVSALLQGTVLLVSVFAIHRIGRWRGGSGSFADALILVGWLQVILLCLQVAQVAAQVLLPPLADVIGVVGIALFFWLLTHFVAELHGFRSLGAVFGGILLSLFGLALALAIVLMPLMGA